MPSTSPKLWVVATPLGNPGDLSPRAREILSRAEVVLAEDTRRAQDQFRRWDLPSRRFLSLHEHNEGQRVEVVLEFLRQGQEVAIISDAGTPCVSDPGYLLVKACREEGIEVSPVPGPSVVVAALSASGLPPVPFTFIGFLPRKEGDVRRLLERYADFPGSLVFFERKDRLGASLEAARSILGSRQLCIVRELTKPHEEFIFGRLEDWPFLEEELRGEITVLLGPPEEGPARTPESEVFDLLRRESALGGKPRDVARRVREQVKGWPAKALYERLNRLPAA